MFAALAASLILTLGGVSINVTSSSSVMPMEPDVAHPEVLWATSQLAMNTKVLMTDESRWIVKRTVRISNGSLQIELRPSSTSFVVNRYVVSAADIHTPIWWVHEIIPVEIPPVEPIDVPAEPLDVPTPPVDVPIEP